MPTLSKLTKEISARYNHIRLLFIKYKDKDGMDLLKSLIRACDTYVGHVAQSEITITRLARKVGFDSEDAVNEQEILDQMRIRFHNAIIADINIINRYLFKRYKSGMIPKGGIYPLKPKGGIYPFKFPGDAGGVVDKNDRRVRANVAKWAGLFLEVLDKVSDEELVKK